MITFSEIYDFISTQPIYIAIPLYALSLIVFIFASLGAYSVYTGFIHNIEYLAEKTSLSETAILLLNVFAYVALYIALFVVDFNG